MREDSHWPKICVEIEIEKEHKIHFYDFLITNWILFVISKQNTLVGDLIVCPSIAIVYIGSYYAMNMVHATNIWVFICSF
jgi:hypothetical protein